MVSLFLKKDGQVCVHGVIKKEGGKNEKAVFNYVNGSR
jgi:hypothetical protein